MGHVVGSNSFYPGVEGDRGETRRQRTVSKTDDRTHSRHPYYNFCLWDLYTRSIAKDAESFLHPVNMWRREDEPDTWIPSLVNQCLSWYNHMYPWWIYRHKAIYLYYSPSHRYVDYPGVNMCHPIRFQFIRHYSAIQSGPPVLYMLFGRKVAETNH